MAATHGDGSDVVVRFELLGSLAVWDGDRVVNVPSATTRSVLAVLLLRPGGVAGVAELIPAVWGRADAGETDAAYQAIGEVRDLLAPLGPRIPRVPYRLTVPDETVDARRYDRLSRSAAALRASEPEEALRLLRAATALWNGVAALPELPLPGVRALAHQLDTRRLADEELLAELEIQVGRPDAALCRVRELADAHRGHPGIVAALIRLLYATGHVEEADRAYQLARRRYAPDVPAALGRAYLERPTGVGLPAGTGLAQLPPPAEIRPAPRHFTGRTRELAWLTRPREGRPGGAVLGVSGVAGVGKTALALRAAQQLIAAGRFPDGHLYADLRGCSALPPVDPAVALENLLRSLDVPVDRIPAGLEARAALYRTVLADRKVLVLLENARDEAQVRHLLPGTTNSTVLITSRRRLADLAGADTFDLDVLPVAAATELFRAVAAPHDAGRQDEIEKITGICGLLPLAIRIAAALLRASPAMRAGSLLALLRTERARLAVLDDGSRHIVTAFDVAYRQLTPELQDTFSGLSLHPGADLEPDSVGALLDLPPQQARRRLEALEQDNLLEQVAAGRYRFHELIRRYAAATYGGTDEDRGAALDRLYDHYAQRTSASVATAYPDELVRLPEPDAGAVDPAGKWAALDWLDAELADLLGTALYAGEHGRPDHLVHQSALLHRHLRVRGRHREARELHEAALLAARAGDDRRHEPLLLVNLGSVYRSLTEYDRADSCFAQALPAAPPPG